MLKLSINAAHARESSKTNGAIYDPEEVSRLLQAVAINEPIVRWKFITL